MPTYHANERPIMVAGEERNAAVSFASLLDEGELLTGTPTIREVEEVAGVWVAASPASLTFSDIAVNVAERTINGERVPIGHAVQFKVVGAVEDVVHVIEITAVTDATPAQTFVRRVPLVGA